jgi:DNA gyrase subunit A
MEIGIVKPVGIDSEMRTSYLDYAMSVIVSRALPDVRDGLKPVHRRILYAMNELSLHHSSSYKKSARIVGEVLGKYHPHGDTAVYDAMVRMAQDFSMRYPLVDGQGNFGSVDGDSPAAMRYTEARMAAITEELLADIDKNTVDFVPNFDASLQEPSVMPARLPNLLLNGSSGIAVGMATNIPPHNLNEVCDGIVHLIDNPEATPDELSEIITGPDFPTGGIILGREGIKSAYGTGKGLVTIRAKAHIEEGKGTRFVIVVSELPYQVNKAALLEKIAQLVKDGRIEGISDLRDESDRTGMRMVIELKRDARPTKVLNQLFKYTQMQTTFGVNMLALVDGVQPRVLTLKRLLQHYVEYRREIIARRSQFDLDKARARAHILEGLKIALDNLDEVIRTIRQSQTVESAKNNLVRNFKLSEIQAQAILDMQLRRLAALERKKIEDEYRELIKLIAYLEDLLANPHKILFLIKEDLAELKKKYGDERRTHITDEVGEFSENDLIPDVEVLVSITNRGYIKRLPRDTYRTQRRGGRGITGMVTRETDAVEHLLACNTHDNILFFTDKGRVFQLKAHQVPDASRTAKGLPLINLISIDPGELITKVIGIDDFSKADYLVMATKQGRIKRTSLEDYSSVRSSGIIAMLLDDGDQVAAVRMTSGGEDILLVTKHGQAIRFSEDEARPMGRVTTGVVGIRLKKGDSVISMDLATPGSDLLIVTSEGFGKRTPVKDYPVQGRAGQGVIGISLFKETGVVAAARVVRETDDLMLISEQGLVIRLVAANISEYGRATRGVKVMNMREGDKVASIACIDGQCDSETVIPESLFSSKVEKVAIGQPKDKAEAKTEGAKKAAPPTSIKSSAEKPPVKPASEDKPKTPKPQAKTTSSRPVGGAKIETKAPAGSRKPESKAGPQAPVRPKASGKTETSPKPKVSGPAPKKTPMPKSPTDRKK